MKLKLGCGDKIPGGYVNAEVVESRAGQATGRDLRLHTPRSLPEIMQRARLRQRLAKLRGDGFTAPGGRLGRMALSRLRHGL